MQKSAPRFRSALFRKFRRNLHHSAHSAHAAGRRHRGFFLFLDVRDQALRGQQQTCDRSRVLQRRTGDLRRIENTGLDHVDIFAGRDVEADVALGLFHALNHDTALVAAVRGELTQRLFDCALDDRGTSGLVAGELELADRGSRTDQRNTAAGVDVRVIYDDVGSLNTLPMNYAHKFEAETGIPCCFFNRFKPIISIRMNNRDHRKFCIIDGHTAFTGGINLADEYINQKPRFGHWKDSAILLKGEAAWSMTVMFLTMWDHCCGWEEEFHHFRPEPAPARPWTGYVQPYTDTPLDREAVGQAVYLNMIGKARKYIYITTPYLVIDVATNTALCNAAKSGVDVRIITPHIPDKRYVFEVTRAHYPPLLEAGVRIYEYTPGFIHAKSIAVDDSLFITGSANMDIRSFELNFETCAFLYDEKSAEEG